MYKWNRKILTCAYKSYIGVICINAFYQYYMLLKFISLSPLYWSYVILCHLVMYDDVKLLGFLRHEINKLKKFD